MFEGMTNEEAGRFMIRHLRTEVDIFESFGYEFRIHGRHKDPYGGLWVNLIGEKEHLRGKKCHLTSLVPLIVDCENRDRIIREMVEEFDKKFKIKRIRSRW